MTELQRERKREYQKKYRRMHAEQIKEYHKKYRQAHLGQVREYRKEYYKTHPEQKKESDKKYRLTHPEIIRANIARHRIRLENAIVEEVSPREIFKRDGWRCQICGERVNPKLKYPHPFSASLDHIIPLSLGGTHERKNLQLAHLKCNQKKNNGGQPRIKLSLEELEGLSLCFPDRILTRYHYCEYLDLSGPALCPFEKGNFFCNRLGTEPCPYRSPWIAYEELEWSIDTVPNFLS